MEVRGHPLECPGQWLGGVHARPPAALGTPPWPAASGVDGPPAGHSPLSGRKVHRRRNTRRMLVRARFGRARRPPLRAACRARPAPQNHFPVPQNHCPVPAQTSSGPCGQHPAGRCGEGVGTAHRQGEHRSPPLHRRDGLLSAPPQPPKHCQRLRAPFWRAKRGRRAADSSRGEEVPRKDLRSPQSPRDSLQP